ncbi:MAG TPA: hypothetical protein VNM16_04230 [Bacillota bacterium]|nr:hypothetical protein [Bacillota bacterium]
MVTEPEEPALLAEVVAAALVLDPLLLLALPLLLAAAAVLDGAAAWPHAVRRTIPPVRAVTPNRLAHPGAIAFLA